MLKIKTFLALTLMAAFFSFVLSLPVFTALGPTMKGSHALAVNTDPCHPELHTPKGQPLTAAQLANCVACNSKNYSNAAAKNCLKTNPLVIDLNLVIDALAGLVGLVSIAMIIAGGVQYSMARNNSQTISNARTRIMNGGIALISFFFLWALLQYLVPGGVFNS